MEVVLKDFFYRENEIITKDFCVCAVLEIGLKDSIGADHFFVKIGTLQGIKNFYNDDSLIICRGVMFVEEFNLELILKEFNSVILKCTKDTWEQTAWCINAYFPWEYEKFKLGRDNTLLQN